jgi:hypothetical protein
MVPGWYGAGRGSGKDFCAWLPAAIVVRHAARAPAGANAVEPGGVVLEDPAMVTLYRQARRAAKSPLRATRSRSSTCGRASRDRLLYTSAGSGAS